MTDNRESGGNRPSEATAGEKALEGSRGGVVLPIQTAPLDITNQVGGLPPADSSSSGTSGPPGTPSGEE